MKSQDEMNKSLQHSCLQQDIEGVRRLLNTGKVDASCCNGDGITPLHDSVLISSNTDIEELLIMHGADVNARCNSGKTPLIVAIESFHNHSIPLLLRHRADINVKINSNDWTALHEAAFRNHRETAKTLLEHKADCTLKSKLGRTAADFAKNQGLKDLLNEAIKEQSLSKAGPK